MIKFLTTRIYDKQLHIENIENTIKRLRSILKNKVKEYKDPIRLEWESANQLYKDLNLY